MSGKRKDILIIGAGIAGIATAVRLAVKGHRVKVFEKNNHPGGKLSEFRLGDYRFDLGPSLFTLPHLVTELFALAGKDPGDFFSYKKVEIACRYFWEDGTIIDAWTDTGKFSRELRMKLGVKEETVRKYLSHTQKLYRYTAPVFLENPLNISFLPLKKLLPAAGYIHKMDLFTTMNKANRRRLGNDKLVQIFNRMATYNGSNPYKAPGVLNVVSSLEHGNGVFFPENGMYSITASLVGLAEELGVEFHLEEEVHEILLQNNSVKGLRTGSGIYEGDTVVSNADIVPTYRHLLKGVKAPEIILNRERSSSAIVFYWGITRQFPGLDLHNIFFSNNYRQEFHYLFNRLDLYHDPTVYVNVSSRMNPADAPPGHENWFVMINAPHNNGQSWEKLIDRCREVVLKKLNKILQADISPSIARESVLDPAGIESLSSSWKGSLYGASSNSPLAAFFRHPNYSRKIRGLYFAGGSVHPGGGIPLCLLSAKITSRLIEKNA